MPAAGILLLCNGQICRKCFSNFKCPNNHLEKDNRSCFFTGPATILIGQLTRLWRDKLPDWERSANAGKWIGMVERIIILIFVLQNQHSAIGLLVAAKSIIRLNEKDRAEVKTEYLVIGTLLSISLAITTGLLAI